MRKGSKGPGVGLKGDSGKAGVKRWGGEQVWEKLQTAKGGNSRHRNVMRRTTNGRWEEMTNFYEDYFEIISDMSLGRASFVLILGLRLLNSKWYSFSNAALSKIESSWEANGGKWYWGKIIATWISWLRYPCLEHHFYGKYSGHCLTAAYISVIYGFIKDLHTQIISFDLYNLEKQTSGFPF